MADKRLADHRFPTFAPAATTFLTQEPGDRDAALLRCGVKQNRKRPFRCRCRTSSCADRRLLPARGAGDIRRTFHPFQWKVRHSMFVEHAANIVREAGGRIANVDVTFIEAPKIGPHRI